MSEVILRNVVEFTSSEANLHTLIRRILTIYKTSGAIILWRLLRRTKIEQLTKQLKHTNALSVFVLLYPLMNKINGGLKWCSWNIAIILSVLSTGVQVPNWLVSFVSTESVIGLLSETPSWFRSWFEDMDRRSKVLIRQALTSATIPLLYKATVEPGWLNWFLFSPRPFLSDFGGFYLVWNISSLCNLAKASLSKIKEDEKPSKGQLINGMNYQCANPYSKHLLDKIHERNELKYGKNIGRLEKVVSRTISENFLVCIKWAAWRQCIKWLFTCSSTRSLSSLQRAAVIMLSFITLNGGKYLDVDFTAIKCLIRCIITQKLYSTQYMFHLMLFLTGLNFEFYKVHHFMH